MVPEKEIVVGHRSEVWLVAVSVTSVTSNGGSTGEVVALCAVKAITTTASMDKDKRICVSSVFLLVSLAVVVIPQI